MVYLAQISEVIEGIYSVAGDGEFTSRDVRGIAGAQTLRQLHYWGHILRIKKTRTGSAYQPLTYRLNRDVPVVRRAIANVEKTRGEEAEK